MGYPTKVQVIQRQASQQWYVNFPAALAGAMEFQKGEIIEWVVQDKDTLVLRRTSRLSAQQAARKKKR
jgi:antitoxin component of MazEF toxin-antitoxin module